MDGVDHILLDNMSLDELREAVAARGEHAKPLLEASGGVTLETVREIAQTGVDFISVGALTHSAPALDIGLDFIPALMSSAMADDFSGIAARISRSIPPSGPGNRRLDQ